MFTDPTSGHPSLPPLSSSVVREKTNQEHTPQKSRVCASTPALQGRGAIPTSELAEITASKNQLVDRGDGTSKNVIHEKTPLSAGLEKNSQKIPEEKGAKVSAKKILTEVEKVSSKTPLVPNTTTTVTSGSLTKNPAPVSDKGEKKNKLWLLP